jgi:hypothetical protein
MWCPPTPPQELSDVYIDHNMDFLYESSPIPEDKLPSIHLRRDLKRARDYLTASDRDSRRPYNKLRRTGEEVVGGSHAPRFVLEKIFKDLIFCFRSN